LAMLIPASAAPITASANLDSEEAIQAEHNLVPVEDEQYQPPIFTHQEPRIDRPISISESSYIPPIFAHSDPRVVQRQSAAEPQLDPVRLDVLSITSK
jgi:hypothetical protein